MTRMTITIKPRTYMSEEQAEVMEAYVQASSRMVGRQTFAEWHIVDGNGNRLSGKNVAGIVLNLKRKRWIRKPIAGLINQLELTDTGKGALRRWREEWPRVDGLPSPAEIPDEE